MAIFTPQNEWYSITAQVPTGGGPIAYVVRNKWLSLSALEIRREKMWYFEVLIIFVTFRDLGQLVYPHAWNWVGLTDLVVEGSWKWIGPYPSNNGSVATSSQAGWDIGQPKAMLMYGNSPCDCAVFPSFNQLKLTSWSCAYDEQFVCEKAL